MKKLILLTPLLFQRNEIVPMLEIEYIDDREMIVIEPFLEEVNYGRDKLIFQLGDKTVEKDLLTEGDQTIILKPDTFMGANLFRYHHISNGVATSSRTFNLPRINNINENIYLNDTNWVEMISLPKKVKYYDSNPRIIDFYNVQFTNINHSNEYALPVSSAIQVDSSELNIKPKTLEYRYDNVIIKDNNPVYKNNEILNTVFYGWDKTMQVDLWNETTTSEMVLSDPYKSNQIIQARSEIKVSNIFDINVNINSILKFKHPLISINGDATYNVNVGETIDWKSWDDIYDFEKNTIDSILSKGVTINEINNHKV